MSDFLHVCVGPYQMLIEAEGIHEIIEIGPDGAPTAGRRDWRGRALTTVNARALLGMADAVLPPEHAGVVYSADDVAAPVLIELDRVARLRRAEKADLLPLPGVADRVRMLFDGVLHDPESGRQLYHLRRPLAADALIAGTSASGNDAGAEATNDVRTSVAPTEAATAAPENGTPPQTKRRRSSRKRR